MRKTSMYVRLVLAVLLLAGTVPLDLAAQEGPTTYIRYLHGSTISFGIKDGDTVRELRGDLFANPQPTGQTYNLSDVKLLAPLDWRNVTKVIGVGNNSAAPGETKPVAHPTLFAKYSEHIVSDGSEVPVFPESVGGLIYEAELVVVVGKTARYVSVEDAPEYIFGATVGNDLQELDWWMNGTTGKNGTTQPGTFLAKNQEASVGIAPEILTGVNYNDLALTVRKNGKAISVQRTSQYNNTPEQVVSYLSRYMTLNPGDLIYLSCLCAGRDIGHPNQKLFAGDEMEYELEGGAKLRQTMVAPNVPAGATTWPDGFADRMDITTMQWFPEPMMGPEDATPGAEK